MHITFKKITEFQRKIFKYYKKHNRLLPWRKTTDPYAILLSEIMLQQTQVERVLKYYNRWLTTWPTIHQLAKAKRSDVLLEWLGLGYNNRAKNLHETSKIISEKFDGDILLAMGHYTELPGIGPYTSHAVRIFSGNEDIATVDTNIRRILIHDFWLDEKTSDRELWELAERCLPKGRSRDWHNALMDYGATLLTSRKSGIKPKTIQSKFEGSDRQIRVHLLRFFLSNKEKSITLSSLKKSIKNTINSRDIQNEKPKQWPNDERMEKILSTMVRDNLLSKKRKKYLLSE